MDPHIVGTTVRQRLELTCGDSEIAVCVPRAYANLGDQQGTRLARTTSRTTRQASANTDHPIRRPDRGHGAARARGVTVRARAEACGIEGFPCVYFNEYKFDFAVAPAPPRRCLPWPASILPQVRAPAPPSRASSETTLRLCRSRHYHLSLPSRPPPRSPRARRDSVKRVFWRLYIPRPASATPVVRMASPNVLDSDFLATVNVSSGFHPLARSPSLGRHIASRPPTRLPRSALYLAPVLLSLHRYQLHSVANAFANNPPPPPKSRAGPAAGGAEWVRFGGEFGRAFLANAGDNNEIVGSEILDGGGMHAQEGEDAVCTAINELRGVAGYRRCQHGQARQSPSSSSSPLPLAHDARTMVALGEGRGQRGATLPPTAMERRPRVPCHCVALPFSSGRRRAGQFGIFGELARAGSGRRTTGGEDKDVWEFDKCVLG
ncbi:hypothetical protein B0H16DRAFT_715207 [Mycena metata]|uniref:Uncharacterized protein n=1 Tax=Mycena metata TaxID=1033252 RepID=A0AAD7J487_9AGAR|nr:hypothetical protein B0H16DRAFT_715207 [Mycena metata]